ncbi:MAG: NAD-dependent epimerase/dehydratase family protein [Azoarcus sp.]
MNVLVSGAGGFVGRALCAALLAAGCRVYGTSRDEGADLLPGVIIRVRQLIS